MCRNNNDVVSKKVVFGFGETLVGDDFAEGLVGGVRVWREEGHRLVEFSREGSVGVILRLRGWQVIKMVTEPSSACLSESFVNFCFIKRKIFESFLVVEGAGIHRADEFHNGDGEVGVAV